MPKVRRVVTDIDTHHLLRLAPAVPLVLRAAAVRTGRIEGIASPFGPPPDRQGDVVQAGAFTKSLRGHARLGTTPAMLWQHRAEAPIGRWLDAREEREGLVVEGQVNLNSADGRKAFEHIAAGDAAGLSMGYLTPEDGRKYVGAGTFELTEVDLVEVSITPVPASPRARLTAVKSLTSRAELVDLLREVGLAKTAALRIASGGWPALTGEDRDEAAMRLVGAIEKSMKHLKGA